MNRLNGMGGGGSATPVNEYEASDNGDDFGGRNDNYDDEEVRQVRTRELADADSIRMWAKGGSKRESSLIRPETASLGRTVSTPTQRSSIRQRHATCPRRTDPRWFWRDRR